jgi:hypothetical protein
MVSPAGGSGGGRRGRPRKPRPAPDAVLGPLEGGRRTADPATRKRIAELAAQVARGDYHPVERIREVFGMSEPSKGGK